MNPRNFFSELKRRRVYSVAVAYVVVAWLLIQVATQVFPFFEIPNWAVLLVVLLLTLGFPAVLIFSWAFEITPEGIKRESEVAPAKSITRRTGRKIVAITTVLAGAEPNGKSRQKPIGKVLLEFAGRAESLPPDYSANLDHYLYAHAEGRP